jgi:histidine triad (HIT) family protein
MSDSCLFCRIIRGEIPATLVAEGPKCVAFRDIDPKAPVHILVIPREHVGSLDEARDAQVLGEILLMVADLARKEGVAESGYRTVINTNDDGGQSVGHLHAHLLGGRRLSWPPG